MIELSSIVSEKLYQIDQNHAKIAEFRPLSILELNQLRAYFKIGLTYSSNALEGNSLTETETKVVLEDGLTISGKPLRDHLEALGHQDAFNQLYQWLDHPLSEALICDIHRLFYYRINSECAGVYRKEKIIVSGTSRIFPDPKKVPERMGNLISRWDTLSFTLHPVIKAAWLHYHLVEIHPFIDGNGRTARLLMNLILIQHGYPIAIIPPIFRVRYLDALKDYNIGKAEPFFDLIVDAVLESQKDYLRLFRASE